MKYHSLKIAEKIWFSLTVNYDINKCFSSYEIKQKLKMFPQACNILKCCREISPMKMRVFMKKIASKFLFAMSDFPLTRFDQKTTTEWQTVVSPRAIFPLKITIWTSDRQGQSLMKWQQISHLKYHGGNPGKFTVQLSKLNRLRKERFQRFILRVNKYTGITTTCYKMHLQTKNNCRSRISLAQIM